MSVVIKDSVRLRMASGKADTVSGVATIEITVPADRWVSGGSGWFDSHTDGDKVFVEVWHPQAGKIDSFTDELVGAENQGWFLPPTGKADIGTLITNDPAYLPAGLILKLIATKASGSGEGTFYANLMWGERK